MKSVRFLNKEGFMFQWEKNEAFKAAISCIPVLLFLFLISYPKNSFSEDMELKTVEAVGFSTISGGNTALARDGAIDDALRKAVEQAVGTMVSSETLVENFEVLQDNIYTKSQGYIKNYTVTGESQNQNLYQVSVKATVAVGNLKNELDAIGLLHAKAEKPRVLFMIAEQNIGHKYYVFWWWGASEYMGETVDMAASETALKESFLSKGFNVVDISGTTGSFEISKAFKVADLTNEGAREIGRKVNAEIVIKGKALAKEGPRTPGSAVGSYIADITAQAIRIDDGVVLASAKGHGVSRHVSDVTGGTEALAKASGELADRMIGQILAKWSSGSGNITLRINGMTDYARITDLKNAVKKNIRGVNAIYQRSVEGGTAVLELDSKVSAQSLADSLSRLPGFSIKVTGTTPNTIDISVDKQ